MFQRVRVAAGPDASKCASPAPTLTIEGSGDSTLLPAATRRREMLTLATTAALAAVSGGRPAGASDVEILADEPGFGKLEASANDLMLVHFVGKVKESGAVFDSTRGGLTYLDGGPGVYRPMIVRLGGGPVPGICAGLKQGLLGTRVGSVRTIQVPAELGFGSQSVAGPYAVVPGGSALVYEVEVLRLSRDGPDALMRGIAKCGQGGAGAQETGCTEISPME